MISGSTGLGAEPPIGVKVVQLPAKMVTAIGTGLGKGIGQAVTVIVGATFVGIVAFTLSTYIGYRLGKRRT